MDSVEDKMCSDTNTVVGKVPRRRKKGKHILVSVRFLEVISTDLSTWKRPLCSPYSTTVHSPSPMNQYRTSCKNDGKPRYAR